MKIIRRILNSRLAGYFVGFICSVFFGMSHILTLEEAEKFSEPRQRK
ncbi:conserved exported hypothetical protein [Xenorhabdus innexi]|uniref:Uncharacterized protein n=1 Tax=Xenorhabdus innexi TaxID=290109 RepID=A0A1N6MXT3_9GAMM|nr:hypothetical protein [Xenorhabdus innexi]PHM31208.1 hypothetical protein Xinn_02986 [Xenorhabdus innexi]SIP73650.1 conserved exported hypothetical protein [Xenorhabdus innexi]